MNGAGWDTRGAGATRRGGGYRLAIVLAAALLTVAILAAVTGKVLASNPPVLPDSSPTADHIEPPAPDLSSELPDPRGLFLDLPEPPRPQAPETPDVNLDDRNFGGRTSGDRIPGDRDSEDRNLEDRGASAGASVGEASSNRSSGGVGDSRSLEGGTADIPTGAAGSGQVPSVQPVKPGSGKVEDLLDDPDCQFSIFALTDLRNGVVDEYLISALQAVCREHSIYVNVFKTGHTFGAGLEEGPTIPAGYGEAGGYPNTHYFGRAADIWEVDGKPVEGNGADPDVVSVGRILAGLPSRNGPDVVIGPDSWNRALGYGPDQGWVLAPDQVALHYDHFHIGYWHGDGTPPPQVYLSPEQLREPSLLTNGGGLQTSALRRSDSDVDRSKDKTPPKLKETREPVESPAPKPPTARAAEEPKDREKSETQRSIVRRTQRSGSQDTDTEKAGPKKPGSDKTDPETTREPIREPRDREPETNIRPPADEEDRREPEETSPSEDQYTDIEEALVQNEIVKQEMTSGGDTAAGDAGMKD